MGNIFIIAEIGINHNGDLNTALEMINVASRIGADAAKIQTFKAKELVTQTARKARYQEVNTGDLGSQLEMLERLELSYADHRTIQEYCSEKNIEFMSTAFDQESLRFLIEDLGVKRLKIGSGEITNGPLLLAHARSEIDIILSTGMANIEEIKAALQLLSFGYLKKGDPIGNTSIVAFDSLEGHQIVRDKVTLLHCTTQYPAPLEDANIRAMVGMRNYFNLDVGYSDHTDGITASLAAVTLGATVIEKHLTLDKTLPGPDHQASLEPAVFEMLVTAIREVELCLGSEVKDVQISERENKSVARKSLVASRPIKKGEKFSKENIVAKRPGTGRSPMEYWEMLGTQSARSYMPDEIIE